jgi:hypothetical protein
MGKLVLRKTIQCYKKLWLTQKLAYKIDYKRKAAILKTTGLGEIFEDLNERSSWVSEGTF